MHNYVGSATLLPVCLLLLALGPVQAGSLQVAPTRVMLTPAGGAESIRLRNLGDTATLIQVEAVAWSDDLNTAPRADEIIAVPPVFEIAGRGEQLVRIALRKPSDSRTEQAYRLLIAEVPRQSGNGQGIMFSLRLDLPLFVTPKDALPAPVWTIRRAADGAPELVLRNEGQAHLRVGKLDVRRAGDATPLFTTDKAGFALAGQEHVWRLDPPIQAPPHLLEVHAETPLGRVPVPYAGPNH